MRPAEPEAFSARAREALAERLEGDGTSTPPPAAPGTPPPPGSAAGVGVEVPSPPSPEDVANAEALIEAVLRLGELGLAFVAPKPSRELGKRAADTAARAAVRGAAQLRAAMGGALGFVGFACAVAVAPGLAGFARRVRVRRSKASRAQLQPVEQPSTAGSTP